MKELSIEEKAKAYDELKVKASQIYNKENDVLIMHTIEDLFPELKESEDERISREITDFICWATDRGCITKEQVEKSNSWLAWLDKQASPVLSNSSNNGKNAWSEEDECNIQDIDSVLFYNENLSEDTSMELRNWLQSLRDRVQPQPKQEWSEEDEEHIESILKRLDGMCKKGATFTETCFAVNQDMDWLKSLKDRLITTSSPAVQAPT